MKIRQNAYHPRHWKHSQNVIQRVLREKKGFGVTHFIQMKSKVFLVLSATLQPLEIKYPSNLIH